MCCLYTSKQLLSLLLYICNRLQMMLKYGKNKKVTNKSQLRDVLYHSATFLWFVTIQIHGNMEYVCFILIKSKMLLMVMLAMHLFSNRLQVRIIKIACIIKFEFII